MPDQDHGHDDGDYHPRDAVASATKAVMYSGTAGLIVSGVQNALARENRGLFGVFTKTGTTFGMFVMMGGTYAFVKDASANLREKSDAWNAALAGFFAGSLIGIPSGRMPRVLGFGAGLSIILAAFERAGGTFRGDKWRHADVDEYARKEAMRLRRRAPYEETLDEVGEGRGIYGPGYAERRAARLKERYGIDVPVEPEKPYAV